MKVTITSRFNEQEGFRTHQHNGIDLSFPKGSDIHSVHSGTVESVTNYVDNIGKGVIVRNDNGEVSIYGHLESINVKEGQRVGEGDLIGMSGNSGSVYGKNGGYHLHYGEKMNGEFIDPTQHADQLINMSGNTSNNPVIDFFKERGKVNNYGGEDYNFWADTVGNFLMTEGKEFCIESFNYITLHLPEIMGTLTMLAATLIMIGVKFPKVLTWYGFTMVVGVFWRMTT